MAKKLPKLYLEGYEDAKQHALNAVKFMLEFREDGRQKVSHVFADERSKMPIEVAVLKDLKAMLMDEMVSDPEDRRN